MVPVCPLIFITEITTKYILINYAVLHEFN